MTTRPAVHIRSSCPLGSLELRTATARDVAAVDYWQEPFKNEIGFFPRAQILDHIERRSVAMIELDGDECGYVTLSAGLRIPATLRQVAVDKDLWRNGIGAHTVRLLVASTREWSAHRVMYVRTREDLHDQRAINSRLAGRIISQSAGDNARRKRVQTWELPVERAPYKLRSGARSDALLVGIVDDASAYLEREQRRAHHEETDGDESARNGHGRTKRQRR